MTTFEEARRCPKCQQVGDKRSERFVGQGIKILLLFCTNTRCTWYDTPWPVQVNPDGSIPDPPRHRDKNFPKIPDLTDRVQSALDRQIASELQSGGTEIPGN